MRRVFFIFLTQKMVSRPRKCVRLQICGGDGCQWGTHASSGINQLRMLQRFLFLIKWSGWSAWPACRLIALCNSPLSSFWLLCTTFAMFSRLLCNGRELHATFSDALSLKLLWKEQRRNLTCKQPKIWCSFTMRPLRWFYSAMEHRRCRNLLT